MTLDKDKEEKFPLFVQSKIEIELQLSQIRGEKPNLDRILIENLSLDENETETAEVFVVGVG